MKYYKFRHVFEQYCQQVEAQEDKTHKEGQVREKFTEIAEAVGIDINLLRTECDENHEPIKKEVHQRIPIRFPEESVQFVLDILLNHTSYDYKCIRRGDFDEASLKTLEFLNKGFCDYLIDLNYPLWVVLREKDAMERRMRLRWHRSRDSLISQCVRLIADAEEYQNGMMNMNHKDKEVFIPFMADSVEELRDRICQIHGCYADIRSEELSELAMEEAEREDTQTSVETVNKELQLGYELTNDKEYQRLIKERDKLVASYDFVKNKKTTYELLSEKIRQIYKTHRKEIFGIDEEENDPAIIVKNPQAVLVEAVEYVEEMEAHREKFRVSNLRKTDAEREEEKRIAEKILKQLEEEREARKKAEEIRNRRYRHEENPN